MKALISDKVDVDLYRLAFDIAKFGIWDWDLTTGDIHWSPEMFNIFSLKDKKVSIEELSKPAKVKYKEKISKALTKAVKLKKRYNEIYQLTNEKWIHAMGESVSVKGKPHFIGVAMDITKIKKQESDVKSLVMTLQKQVGEQRKMIRYHERKNNDLAKELVDILND